MSTKKAKTAEVEILSPETEEEKMGRAIIVASAKGYALATTFGDASVSALQKTVGKNFVVTATGLTLAEGVEFTEKDAAQVISTLAETTERETQVKTIINLALGDAVVAVKDKFGDEQGDKLIEQAVAVRGQSKHTITETERVSRFLNEIYKDRSELPVGLSYTHFMEAKNYARDKSGNKLIAPAKVRSVLQKAAEGNVVATVTLADGTVEEQRKPLSAKATRDLLIAARGDSHKPNKTEKSKKDKEDKEKDDGDDGEPAYESIGSGYIYIFLADTSKVFHSKELDEVVRDSGNYLVLDLDSKEVFCEGAKPVSEIDPWTNDD